ncbi:MAG: mercury resistance system periplasmic binding protein MerP [Gammaproteobacteria bacterium]
MRIGIAGLILFFTLAAGVFAASANNNVVLDVPGMTCPLCPITVRKALERVPGVEKISVDYPARSVRVEYDASRTNVATLLKATADAGYPAKPEKPSRP